MSLTVSTTTAQTGTPKRADQTTTKTIETPTITTVKNQQTEVPDVFTKNGALNFQETPIANDRDLGLERAKKMLQTARLPGKAKLTFGGRVKTGVSDKERSLRNYYPSLQVAHKLAEDPSIESNIRNFLTQVSVPEDLRDLLEQAVLLNAVKQPTSGSNLTAEPAETIKEFSDFLVTRFKCDLDRKGSLRPHNWKELTFDSNGLGNDLMIRVVARMKELYPKISHSNITGWEQQLSLLPDNEESARLVLRFAKAWNLVPSNIDFHGKPLSEYSRKEENEIYLGAEPAAPLKYRDSFENWKDWGPANFGQGVPTADVFVGAFGSEPYLRIVARMKEKHPEANKIWLKDWERKLSGLPNDAESARLVLRFAKAWNLDPSKIDFHGKPLSEYSRKKENWGNLTAEPAGPIKKLSDAHISSTIRLGIQGGGTGPLRPPNWIGPNIPDLPFTHFDAELMIRVVARMKELNANLFHSNITGWEHQLNKLPDNEESARLVLRFAKAWNLDPSKINFHGKPLSAGSLPEKAESPIINNSKLAAFVAKLDPANPVSPIEQREQLSSIFETLTSKSGLGFDAAIIDAKKEGRFQPVSTADLSHAEQKTWVQSLLTEGVFVRPPEIIQKVLFLGVCSDVSADVLAQTVRDAPLSSSLSTRTKGEIASFIASGQIVNWANLSKKLAELSPQAFKMVTEDLCDEQKLSDISRDSRLYDEWKLELNSRMFAIAPSLSKSDIQRALDGILKFDGESSPLHAAKALIRRAYIEPVGTKIREQIVAQVAEKIDSGDFGSRQLEQLMTPEAKSLLSEPAQKKLNESVTNFVKSKFGGADLAKALAEVIQAAGPLADKGVLAENALSQLYQKDLVTRIPLKQADEELGGVKGANPLPDPKDQISVKAKAVDIVGINLAENDRNDKDKKSIPKKQHANLVMTPTTKRNLKMMAAAWRTKRPILLEGPTSSGKTSAVRYIAHKTQSPYRRINLSYYTDVSDLLGKYVGGEKKYDQPKLDKMNDAEFNGIAKEYGIALSKTVDREQATKQILAAQNKPRWVDGPVIKAMKRGEILLLDEINLARPEVLERLNSLLDDDGNIVLTEHHNEVVAPDKNFRLFGTMNPSSYSGRAQLSEAMRSRWNKVYAHGLNQSDLTMIIKESYGSKIPITEMAKLVASHNNLSRLADEGAIGRSSGGVAFTLRNLFRAADRFIRYSGGTLDDEAVMRREVQELYAGSLLVPEDIEAVTDVLETTMPYSGPDFYENLEFIEDNSHFEIGDVSINKLNHSHPLVPVESSRLVMTDRTKQVLYRMAKALDMGENVAMVGERSSGKTAIAKMFAMLRGQTYQRQVLSRETDASELIGGFDDTGWNDGLLLDASRPTGTPGIFVGDEFNLANPALLERLNSVLDDERKLVLAEKEGEEIRLHPEFRFIAAMNPATKKYGGRQKLSKAMQNRFTMIAVPNLDDPTEQKEILKEIGNQRGVDSAVTDTLVDLTQAICADYEDGSLGTEIHERDRPTYSMRELINATKMIAEFMEDRGLENSYSLAVEANFATSSNQDDNDKILRKAEELAQ